ncbi:MAG TPA: hypothetical protein VGZ22_22060 [Isosphaeraceae bacterium]|jgi:hypothetical protein|nr:hypothetical protein [Isosphaeraceae bacterium]
MKDQTFPPGWDADRVRQLIAHYEEQDEEEQVAEDEATLEPPQNVMMAIPSELVPAVRELIARRQGD